MNPLGLANGHYVTAAGSRVEIFGKYAGAYRIDWDWVEENACIECQPCIDDGELAWHCEYCEGGRAKLVPAKEASDADKA